MKQLLKKGATDQSVLIFVPDSSSTTGAGKTGLAYNTASLTCYYVRPGSAAAQLSLVTQTVTGAHTDGGFVEIDATNMPGVYRLDLSDAILATGVNSAVVMLKGASGMAPVILEIELTDFDLHTATPKVDLDTIKTQAITCAGGVTIPAATLASTTNITAGTITTTTNLTNAPTSGDLTATMKASITAAVPSATDNADALLKRDWTSVTGEAARSVLNALRFLRNKWSLSGTTLTVTKEDDSTSAWTATVTTSASADPVTGSDPT